MLWVFRGRNIRDEDELVSVIKNQTIRRNGVRYVLDMEIHSIVLILDIVFA